jgi:hypothetical protein
VNWKWHCYLPTMKSFELTHSPPQSFVIRLTSPTLLLKVLETQEWDLKWNLHELNQPSKYFWWHLFMCDTEKLKMHKCIQMSDCNYHGKNSYSCHWIILTSGLRKDLCEVLHNLVGILKDYKTIHVPFIMHLGQGASTVVSIGVLKKAVSSQSTRNFPRGSSLD